MSRPKNPSTLFIENFLSNNGLSCTYNDLYNSQDYSAFVSHYNTPIEPIMFSQIKSRFKRQGATQSGSVAVAPSFPPVQNNFINIPVVEPQTTVFDDNFESDLEEAVQMSGNSSVPAVDRHFIVDKTNASLMDLVMKRSMIENVNIRLVGPAGCGKTSFAMHYAAVHKRPALIMDCANVREPRDWFGYRTIDPATREIVWHESLFIKMIETAGAVIVLDELNRVSPLVVNTLIPLLDHRRSTYLEEANRTIHCAAGVTFWAAINEGNQFTGTTALDEAVSDRFGMVVECNFLSENDEAKVLTLRSGLDLDTCKKLVEVATQVRAKCDQHGVDTFSKPISTRMLVEAAKGLRLAGTSTIHYTLLNHYSSFGGSSSERQSLAKLFIGKFGSI